MEQNMIPVRPEDFDGVFSRIGKDWMLIGASDGEHDNVMTASWGGLGVLWNKPVAFCFIRPQRYTYLLTEKSDRLSLSFFDNEEYRSALTFCGRASGRDGDKFEGAGLTKALTENGVPYPAEASVVLICHKLYADDIKENAFIDSEMLSHYAKKDYHRVYICEIESVLRKKI